MDKVDMSFEKQAQDQVAEEGRFGSFYIWKTSTENIFRQQLVEHTPKGCYFKIKVESFDWLDKVTAVGNTNPILYLRCTSISNVFNDRENGQPLEASDILIQFRPEVDSVRNKYRYRYQSTSDEFMNIGSQLYNLKFVFTLKDGSTWDFGDEDYTLQLKILICDEDEDEVF